MSVTPAGQFGQGRHDEASARSGEQVRRFEGEVEVAMVLSRMTTRARTDADDGTDQPMIVCRRTPTYTASRVR